jgi:hypothetical protein
MTMWLRHERYTKAKEEQRNEKKNEKKLKVNKKGLKVLGNKTRS